MGLENNTNTGKNSREENLALPENIESGGKFLKKLREKFSGRSGVIPVMAVIASLASSCLDGGRYAEEEGAAEVEKLDDLTLVSYTFYNGGVRANFKPLPEDILITVYPDFGEAFEAKVTSDGILDIPVEDGVNEITCEFGTSAIRLEREEPDKFL